jgi:hypothetical protein
LATAASSNGVRRRGFVGSGFPPGANKRHEKGPHLGNQTRSQKWVPLWVPKMVPLLHRFRVRRYEISFRGRIGFTASSFQGSSFCKPCNKLCASRRHTSRTQEQQGPRRCPSRGHWEPAAPQCRPHRSRCTRAGRQRDLRNTTRATLMRAVIPQRVTTSTRRRQAFTMRARGVARRQEPQDRRYKRAEQRERTQQTTSAESPGRAQ